MGKALTYSDIGSAAIYRARVLDVDSRYYVLTVHSEFLPKPLADISFATPYQHSNNGEGIYFMPEVGSLCWLCEPSDGSKPFVVAWAAASSEGDFRSNKHELNPGDIYLGTRDENHLILRRGGVVQIGATPLAQRLFLPINNIIRDLCESYSLQTLGGDLSWTVDIPESTTDGKRPTRLVVAAREFANDPKAVATLEIGSHANDPDAILSLVLNDSGSVEAKPKITLKLKKTGEVEWKAEGKVTWKFSDEFLMEVTKDATVHSHMTATLEGDEIATVKGGAVVVTSDQGAVAISAKTGTTVTGDESPALKVGSATIPVALATPAFLVWLATHSHPTAAPGPPSPPTQPLPEIKAVDLISS